MEPWDGPASIAFTDGIRIGACLDRNGLRPSRYYVTKDDLVIMASEAGVLPVEPERVLQKGRLQPGRMFLVDTEQGRIVADEELKNKFASAHPYQQWLDEHHVLLENLPEPAEQTQSDAPQTCCSGSRRSATRSRICGSSSARWPTTACSRSARWARTRRWRFCRTSRNCFTIISSSFSRRSPTRRLTRSARKSSPRPRRWSARAATCSSRRPKAAR